MEKKSTAPHWIRVSGVTFSGEREEGVLREKVASALGISASLVEEVRLEKKSLDARRRPPRWECRFLCRLGMRAHVQSFSLRAGVKVEEGVQPPRATVKEEPLSTVPAGCRVVVIGAGPAGLWAALALGRRGVPVVLLERGQTVEKRGPAVNLHWRSGTVDPENNVLFGEGGAGTFSDGKIYTRIRDSAVERVLQDLHDLGAPPDILTDSRPHIGTDRLKVILMRLRQRLTDLGVEMRFSARVDGLRWEGGRLRRVILASGEELAASAVILGPGHSARDTFAWLRDLGVPMEARPTAMGVRMEHPQTLLDRLNYGCPREDVRLPASDYHLAAPEGPGGVRRVWSFCMCPGGKVISASNTEGLQVTNGMSYSKRAADFGNAGMIAQVDLADYAPFGSSNDPLRGFAFQKFWEEKAWEAGGGGFVAPVQRASDFLSGRPGEGEEFSTSYQPGVRGGNLVGCLPRDVVGSLREALRRFDRRWPGFSGKEALLIGIESRTSSPVRILRDRQGECPGFPGLYPVGEGAGYAGGIVSAAVDGVHAATSILETVKKQVEKAY